MIKYKLRQLVAGKEAKDDRRISLTELADACDISRPLLYRMLEQKGAVTTTTIDKLCEYLDCQPGDLLEYEPAPSSKGKKRRS